MKDALKMRVVTMTMMTMVVYGDEDARKNTKSEKLLIYVYDQSSVHLGHQQTFTERMDG